MRLCWDDSTCALGKDNREELKFIHDIGYRMTGIHGDLSATEDDIKRIKDEYAEAGMEIGPFWAMPAPFYPDHALQKEKRELFIELLKLWGKVGVTHVGGAVGSMHPGNIYMHHPENHTQRAMDLLVEHTKMLVPYAEDANCIICPETTQWTIVNSFERMREFVDRVDSPFVRICFDPVNHMTSERIYESGVYIRTAISSIGDCIGSIHCKDVNVTKGAVLVSHIDEARMGTGQLDHQALIEMSTMLEPWETFSLEHIDDSRLLKPAYDHIQGIADRIGHKWTDSKCSRERWLAGQCK